MAKEYIEREAFREVLRRSHESHASNSWEEVLLDRDIRLLNEQPAADVVEVIRCRDCKHWHEETGWCYHHSHFVKSNGGFCHPWESASWKMFDADYWCADGEKRDNNEAD